MYPTLSSIRNLCCVSVGVVNVETRLDDPVMSAHQGVWPGQDRRRTAVQGRPFVTLLDASFAIPTRSYLPVISPVSATSLDSWASLHNHIRGSNLSWPAIPKRLETAVPG